MPSLKTLLSLLAVGSVMIDNPLPKRIVSKVVCAVAAVFISTVMIGALLLALTVYAYQTMVLVHGFAPLEASLYILGVISVLTLIALIFAVCAVKKVVKVIPRSIKKNVPITTHLGNEAVTVVQAFLNGVMGKNGDQGSGRTRDMD